MDTPPTTAAEERRIDSYLARARQLTADDRGLLHELVVGVFWPHRDRDLEFLLKVGQGYIATDEIGRAMASTMYFATETDLCFLGMMTVTPRFQAMGAGRWLLNLVKKDTEGCDLRLTATKQGYPLYVSEGFVPVGPIRQHQGTARPIHLPEDAPGVELRPLQAEDRGAVLALDTHAYGGARPVVLDALMEKSEGKMAYRDGAPVGFAMLRNFGRGRVIGPVVAEDERTAMQMIAPMIQAHEGRFLRMDVPGDTPRLEAFLAAAGLGVYDTVTEMVNGRQRRAAAGPVTFGLASQSLG